ARPQMGTFGAAGEAEYGNFDSMKVKGMVNVPIGDRIGARVAGYYLKRDGYTLNLFDGDRIDDREMYAVRGSLRFEPSDGTTIDLVGQYFHERDNRLRIQKQLCQRDPTGVMGCLAATRNYEMTNANTTFTGVLTSREFFALRGLPTAFALGSLYGTDINAAAFNPADTRVVNTDFTPQYFTDELILQASLEQDLGGGLQLSLSGNYQEVEVDSSQDYNLTVANRAVYAGALASLDAAGNGLLGAGLQAYLRPVQQALIPNGAAGQLCTSLPEPTGTGAFGGNKVCGTTPLDFDRSNSKNSSWTAEAIISSDWDGMFNVLVGGIYGKYKLTENSYYVNAFSIDYFTGVLGAFTSLSGGLAPGYLGTPFFRSNTDRLDIRTLGVFGEAYAKFSDDLKLTVGLRYNNDKKSVSARTTLASYYVPHGSANAFTAAGIRAGGFDADPTTVCAPTGSTIAGALGSVAGCEAFQNARVSYTEYTGRAVLDWNITPDNLLYASYSRGYKSGGINPPLSPVFTVPITFKPEFIDAFEVGSKNTFGALQLNLTGFYYKYKDLQLSRIVARTSVNDNVSANIWGLEAEAIIRPVPEFTVNIGASYLNTKVSEDKLLANPRDFGGGRADAVIIKDITNGANCAVSSNSGSVAGVNGFVNQVNTMINNINAPGNPLTSASTGGLQPGAGLQPTTSFGAGSGLASNGAFSICAIAGNLAASAVGTAFGGITYHSAGITSNIKGNELPGAPNFKFSAGMQYDFALGDMTLTPRMDVIMTGETYGNIFNGSVNAIDGYWQANAQVQLNGADDRWFVRAFVQNMFDDDATTGLYVTDQSSGNYTNIFTLEPRRFGVAAGFKF
ncbi:MAG: TonB-dependent receptor, partial [Sphingorhabdus sp.]|uniref:TonB-dependent receptor domain-containing protein n=1 Tax=Sphingorhabdus sp. TaxID=1902408 RepID=UPI003C858F4D